MCKHRHQYVSYEFKIIIYFRSFGQLLYTMSFFVVNSCLRLLIKPCHFRGSSSEWALQNQLLLINTFWTINRVIFKDKIHQKMAYQGSSHYFHCISFYWMVWQIFYMWHRVILKIKKSVVQKCSVINKTIQCKVLKEGNIP